MKTLLNSLIITTIVSVLSVIPVQAEDKKPHEKPIESFWIGVRVAPIPGLLLPHFGAKEDGPGRVVVEHVVSNGPAAKAGLKRGDVVLKFDDTEIHTLPELMNQIAKAKETAQPLVVMRGGKNENLSITPEKRPEEPNVIVEEEIEEIPGIQVAPEFQREFRNSRQMMRHMENMFRQMQGGTDHANVIMDEDTVNQTEDAAKGEGKRIEVRSHTDADGKTQIHVIKSVKANGKTHKQSWITESIEKLPNEIRSEVESLFNRKN